MAFFNVTSPPEKNVPIGEKYSLLITQCKIIFFEIRVHRCTAVATDHNNQRAFFYHMDGPELGVYFHTLYILKPTKETFVAETFPAGNFVLFCHNRL